MAALPADAKAAFLLNLWEGRDALTLREMLVAMARSQVQLLDGGAIVSSVSQAGSSTSFAVSLDPLRGVTPVSLAALAMELLRRYDWAAAGGSDAEAATADEPTIYARMYSDMFLVPPNGAVRSYLPDFTYAR